MQHVLYIFLRQRGYFRRRLFILRPERHPPTWIQNTILLFHTCSVQYRDLGGSVSRLCAQVVVKRNAPVCGVGCTFIIRSDDLWSFGVIEHGNPGRGTEGRNKISPGLFSLVTKSFCTNLLTLRPSGFFASFTDHATRLLGMRMKYKITKDRSSRTVCLSARRAELVWQQEEFISGTSYTG